MRKEILQLVRATFPLLIAGSAAFINPARSQQWVIANKDNTRPTLSNQNVITPVVTSIGAARYNGYNQILWTAVSEQDAHRFIAEFSTDGVNYQTAGEMLPDGGAYTLRHYTQSALPTIYRIRVVKSDGRFDYSKAVLLEGTSIPVVSIYPTTVTGDLLQANARFPIERILVTSLDGRQVFAKEMGGTSGYLNLGLPPMQAGMYLVTFYGSGWKTTSKFVVPGS